MQTIIEAEPLETLLNFAQRLLDMSLRESVAGTEVVGRFSNVAVKVLPGDTLSILAKRWEHNRYAADTSNVHTLPERPSEKPLDPHAPLAELLSTYPHTLNMTALWIDRFPDEALNGADEQLRKMFTACEFTMSTIAKLYGYHFHADPIPGKGSQPVLFGRMYRKTAKAGE